MNVILDILFPKKCLGCNKSDTYLCQDCILNIRQGELICPRCEDLAVGGQTHPICRTRFGLDGLWSLGVYEGLLKKTIQKLKYEPSLVRDLAPVLVDIFLEYWVRYQPFVLDLIKKDQGRGWAVIPVPLHWFKENKRGFNQAKLLGQLLSKKLNLAYSDSLERTRFTKSQVGLKGRQRKENIKDAFAFSPNHKPLTMNNILLLDDVWTTGSTMKECGYILKRAGARKVWAITLAR